MLNDSTITAALIAGLVLLLISGISRVYAWRRNNKRFEDLKEELLLKSGVEKFLHRKDGFLDKFSVFERELNDINDANPNDGTNAVQYTIDFFASTGKEFYLRNTRLLESHKLNQLNEKISRAANSGKLNEPENHKGKRDFGKDVLDFLSELNRQTPKVN